MKQKTDTLFYRNFFSIYVILVLQNVVTLSVNLADNMMLGGLQRDGSVRRGCGEPDPVHLPAAPDGPGGTGSLYSAASTGDSAGRNP